MKISDKIKNWAYSVLSKLMLDYSTKKMIRLSQKDVTFKKLIGDFHAIIKISSEDELLNKFIQFKGNGMIEYFNGSESLDFDAAIIFRTIEDMFIFLKNYGDIYEGMLENRFELKGNLNILLKYQFLTNYYNPKRKNIQLISEN